MLKGRPPKPVEERFWEKVEKSETCWLWKAGLSPDGYGVFAPYRGKRYARAHRVSYELHHNIELTSSQYICHTCDVPACVNPSHLMIGDAAFNMADKMAKGREARGEASKGKLTEDTVLAIRKKLIEDTVRGRYRRIAVLFNISDTMVRYIDKGLSWKHL